jgi:hypothetical protein
VKDNNADEDKIIKFYMEIIKGRKQEKVSHMQTKNKIKEGR